MRVLLLHKKKTPTALDDFERCRRLLFVQDEIRNLEQDMESIENFFERLDIYTSLVR